MLARPGANHALSGLTFACVFGAGEADCVFSAGEVDCVFGAGEVGCVFGAGEADWVFSRQVLAEGLDALSGTVPASRALSELLFGGSDLVLPLCCRLLRLRTAKCPDCRRSRRGFPSDGLGVDSEPCDRRACSASIFCTET